MNIGDPHDLVAGLMHELCGGRANIAKSLNDDPRVQVLHAEFGESAIAVKQHPSSSSLQAAVRSAQIDRFAGNHRRRCMTHVHRVRIHDPGHGLLVGAKVGRGNVAFRAKPFDQLSCITARNAFQLSVGKLRGIANDAALCATERNVHNRAFPSHPTGQRADLIERHIRRVAYSSLARAADDRVMNPVADKYFQMATIEHHRNVYGNFLVRIL